MKVDQEALNGDEKYQWVTRRSWKLMGRCLWRGEGVNGYEKVLSGDGESLQDDENI